MNRRPRTLTRTAAAASVAAALTMTACSPNSPATSSTSRARPVVPLGTARPTPTATTEQAVADRSPTRRPDNPQVPRTRPTDAFSVGTLWIALVTYHCGPWDPAVHPEQPVTPLKEFPDPAKATIARGPSKHEWLVTDAAGNRMLINVRTIAARPHWAGTVYSVNGPKDDLPIVYTFGCDPKVFLGTWESDPPD